MDVIPIITHILLFLALYIEVYLLLSFLEARDGVQENVRLSETDLPTVAIIVPCFNEETTVAGTLHSLLALRYPQNKLSIIAVNDGSTDGTLSVLKTFKNHSQITVLSKENGGKHSAMNHALAYTKADIVGCLDADSFVESEALYASIQRFSTTGAAAVTPAIVALAPTTWLQFVQQAEYALSVFMRRAFAATNSVFITPGPFSLFKRDIVTKMGGWKHAHGTEDMEMAMRLQEGRYKIVNEPRARVFTKTPATIRTLYRQRVRWTYGFLMNVIDYRHMVLNRGYGALGMIVLPAAVISIAAALYFTGVAVGHGLLEAYSFYERVATVGLSFGIPSLSFFFFNTTSIALIGYTLIVLALALLFTGRAIADAPLHPVSVPLYVLLYSFLAPWWLLGAVSRALMRAQAPWR